MWAALALNSEDVIHLSHIPSIPWSKITSPPPLSLVGHTHDDRYYTETEINNLLANKANKAGDSNQDFSTKNLNVAGYVQVGSARLVYVPADAGTGTQGYIKIQHADGSTAMHLITTGGQTLYSTGVPAAIEELLTEVMVIFNTSEDKADIIIGDRVKSRFMVIVPSTTSGIIAINTIFNNIVPFGYLAEYEIYVYIESNDVTATTLATSCSGISGYTSGLMLGTLQASDISGKGLHKLTYIRDRAAADTHMGLYVKHEYFEKV
jgi:hypothetical protein